MIKLYTTKTCVYCPAVKRWLKERDINYEEVLIDSVEKARLLANKTGKLQVPVLEFPDGRYITGFDLSTYTQTFGKEEEDGSMSILPKQELDQDNRPTVL